MWEKQLDALTEDKKLKTEIPELTCRSGMSDQAALRVLDLAERGIIGINHFSMLCAGGGCHDISEDVFKKWITFLLGSSEINAVFIAFDWYYYYYLQKESKHTLPENLTLELLTHQLLFQRPEAGRHEQMDDFYWAEIGEAFAKRYHGKNLELADRMLEHFGEDGTILDSFRSKTQEVLNEITQRCPEEVWLCITKYLGPQIDSRAFHINEWLRGDEPFDWGAAGALPMIPLNKIWEWVDEDVENHAGYLASFVPTKLFRAEGKICLAREVLVRYGTREDVRRNLIENFFPAGGGIGPISLHYQEKKQQLLDFEKREDDENVKRWIVEYMFTLDQIIERVKVEEERRGF